MNVIKRTKIRFKRGQSDILNEVNLILDPGEPCFELDTYKLKIGDGVTPYKDLDYINKAQPILIDDTLSISGAAADSLTVGRTLEELRQQKLDESKLQEAITEALNKAVESGLFKGEPGSDGLSAYQIAVNNGYVGTEAEWLASLKGQDADPTQLNEIIKNLDSTVEATAPVNGKYNVLTAITQVDGKLSGKEEIQLEKVATSGLIEDLAQMTDTYILINGGTSTQYI